MTLGRSAANSIKIKTDGEAGLRAVSCGCCGQVPPGLCGGCPSVEELTNLTAITIGGNIFGGAMPLTLPSQIVSIVEPFDSVEYSQEYPEYNLTGSAGGSLCGAGNSASYIYGGGVLVESVGVGFSIIRENNECVVQLGASYGLGGPADYSASGNGGTTIPLANLIGTHSFTFPVEQCQQIEVGYDEEMSQPIYATQCNTVNYSAVIAIS